MHVVLVGPEFEENLSLRYLAAALRAGGHTASLARFDSPEYIDGVVQQVRREAPDLVGLSMVFQVRAREFYELARALRRGGYRGHMTAGGHFATFACEEMLKELPELDSVVRQEGEETLLELADALSQDTFPRALTAIPGLVARGPDGTVRLGAKRKQADNLDTLPLPVRDTPPERHLGVPTSYLVGSRGCYADCDYCCIFAWHEAAVGKRYRMRTPANIAEEMALLYHQQGTRFFVFHDDNFFMPTAAGNRKRFTALKEELERREVRDIGLMLKLRPNDCDRENLALLKEMGLLRAFIGLENASAHQLRTLGRDSSIEEVEDCLALLREFEIYCTFNILLFDPYTTLADVEENLRFLRSHLYFPFNWCKVEPYAGTALESRFAAEGRLRGTYLGYDYEMDDPRARLLYDLLLPAFYYRNFDYYGLANLNIGLGYHRQLLRHFYPEQAAPDLLDRAQSLTERINTSALDLMERALAFAAGADPDDQPALQRFREGLRRDSFRAQHQLSNQVEAVLREIETAAGVRERTRAGRSESFTPLALPPEKPVSPVRRRFLAAAGSAAAWLLAACGKQPAAPIPPSAPGTAPQGEVRIAPGSPSEVAAWEPFTLEALLNPPDVRVIGEPRVTCNGGKIRKTTPLDGGRRLLLEYLPSGASSNFDPNVTVTVAWTVAGKDTDAVVVGRAFFHVRDDGTYALGYETPRPTIAEMAAPPLRSGPRPGPGG